MLPNLFYTLFKYKEKAQKDELGYYPEKVDVKAFPERRFLWTSRFFVVVACLSLCLSMILASALNILLPQKKVSVIPLQIDYQLHQVTRMSPDEIRYYAGDLVTESLMAQYITERYTIEDDFDKMVKRLGEGSFLQLASSEAVYKIFEGTEHPYFELLQQRGVRSQVKIDRIYPVSFNFWQVRFKTINTAPDLSVREFMKLMSINLSSAVNPPKQGEPLIMSWIASIRMTFNQQKYKDRELALLNPFGLTVVSYDLSFMGTNIKNKRN
jgi:type IV secretory pathway component VirB8